MIEKIVPMHNAFSTSKSQFVFVNSLYENGIINKYLISLVMLSFSNV